MNGKTATLVRPWARRRLTVWRRGAKRRHGTHRGTDTRGGGVAKGGALELVRVLLDLDGGAVAEAEETWDEEIRARVGSG